jgi:pyruvate dehydrogenase E2 component (dihydrolipoamide acetyltransferase)
MAQERINVPNIGDASDVDVVEVLVKAGDHVEREQTLIVLESEKASMDVPSPRAGTVREISIKVGDKASEGTPILVLELGDGAGAAAPAGQSEKSQGKAAPTKTNGEPQVGKGGAPGRSNGGAERSEERPEAAHPAQADEPDDDDGDQGEPPGEPAAQGDQPDAQRGGGGRQDQEYRAELRTAPPASAASNRPSAAAAPPRLPYASPAVRRTARELGVDLTRVTGTARGGRITKDDVQNFVKRTLNAPPTAAGMFALAEAPEIDFSQFGPVTQQPLTKIQRLTGRNLHRSWVTIPHVTQFDDADITELEEFRKQLRSEHPELKLTLVTFFMKALVFAMKRMPRFNSSLDKTGENLIVKQYFHIGVAVDTPNGLVVPVIRDVDRKTLGELAKELEETSERARARRLTPTDMQGASITISSLGGIGGSAFTPIINPPEVAVLGVSRARFAPVYKDGSFVPRLLCPLSLSYDHRVIDGADGARFTNVLRAVLSDIRQLLL